MKEPDFSAFLHPRYLHRPRNMEEAAHSSSIGAKGREAVARIFGKCESPDNECDALIE